MTIRKTAALFSVFAALMAACGGEATPEAKAPEAATTEEAKPAEGDAAKPAEGDVAAPAGDAAKPEGDKPVEGGDAK